MVKSFMRNSACCQILVLLTFIIFCGYAHAETDELNKALQQGFGDKADFIKEILMAKKIPQGQDPKKSIQAGDTLVFAHWVDPAERVPLYTSGLQGFFHASIVGGQSPKDLFQSFAPSSDTNCIKSFQGSLPYIILRPKKSVTKTKDFGGAVTDMLKQMSLIGYEYDEEFNSHISNMSELQRAKLHAAIVNYRFGDPKPEIPKMYCSAVPLTVYALLGIWPKVSVTIGDLVDIDLKEQTSAGKPKEVVARDSASKIIETMDSGFAQMISALQENLAKIKGEDAASLALRLKLEDQIRSYQNLIQKMDGNRDLLEDYLRYRLGLCQIHQENHKLILSILESLAFYFRSQSPVVRPIDFLKDALLPDGNFDIVGVYQGGGDSPCF